ncbi:hypothetical protein HELRODRAFT_85733, partial [Helobdella robusta]|uniref:ATP synthase mitochondrial F1 complex assembly factor 2 n=1 Tax=Helobdella robusta TaxID=6412 RepID=T1G625_HELRO
EIKRFYKNVTITKSNGGFEVNLDRHKLRTPLGNVLLIPSEPIALGVAEEWRSQDKTINKFNMHLTSLANMCADRNGLKDRDCIIRKMLEYLSTDTVCFRADSPKELVDLQNEKWNGLVDSLERRFQVEIPVTSGLSVPKIPENTTHTFTQYLKSFSDWSLVGYEQAVDCLKSFVIATHAVNRELSIVQAVSLSHLEIQFQTSLWGTVEWKHTMDETETKARLAAAVLFVHFNSSSSEKIDKNSFKKFINV